MNARHATARSRVFEEALEGKGAARLCHRHWATHCWARCNRSAHHVVYGSVVSLHACAFVLFYLYIFSLFFCASFFSPVVRFGVMVCSSFTYCCLCIVHSITYAQCAMGWGVKVQTVAHESDRTTRVTSASRIVLLTCCVVSCLGKVTIQSLWSLAVLLQAKSNELRVVNFG